MPEDENYDEGQEPEGGESGNIRLLREQAKAGKDAIAAEAALRREVAFLKAGIDTDSKLGSLLFKSYDGELTTEAIQTEAREIGALEPVVVEPTSEGESQEPTGTTERQDLANGAPADEPANEHPVEIARKAYDSAMGRGATFEEAGGEFIHALAVAAQAGDKRAIFEGYTR